MKTFDEYIQGRIYEAYENETHRNGFFDCVYSIYSELAHSFGDDGHFDFDEILESIRGWRVGKQRAKDYAHYIVAWLEKQKGPLYTSAVAYADEPAIEKSHLTDEDSKHIKNLAKEMVNAYSLQHQDNTATKLINFINSLKGE